MIKYDRVVSKRSEKLKVGIVGATGYTGSELIRILANHADVSIEIVTSGKHAGKSLAEIHPQFLDAVDLELSSTDNIRRKKLDLVFLALPHGTSMEFVRDYGYNKFRLIDLSGDFRLRPIALYEQWYKQNHLARGELAKAVYGLPELFRDRIRKARLVANPGCYPTGAILALAPLLKRRLVKPRTIIVDSKSGVTGAGAKAKAETHFPEVAGNFKAYGLLNHRHTPEIQATLQTYTRQKTAVLFTPHLLPIDRGILTTAYSIPTAPAEMSTELLSDYYASFYDKEHFVRVVNQPPEVKNVRGSNYCDVYVTYDERTRRIITISAIDNLVKGAAGQAVQNMNIMFNIIEPRGLRALPLCP